MFRYREKNHLQLNKLIDLLFFTFCFVCLYLITNITDNRKNKGLIDYTLGDKNYSDIDYKIHLTRPLGPRIWVKDTNNWGPKTPISKLGEFPGYNDPIPRFGRVKRKVAKPRTSVGSAIAVSDNGLWLTSKHVVDSCKQIIIQPGLQNGRAASIKPTLILFHPIADIAIISTVKTDYNRLAFRVREKDDQARDGYHIGFPRGRPGAVHSRLIGKMKIRRGRIRKHTENMLVWAEYSRIPDFSGSIGGMSGGATIDSTGALIGINSAASMRRGRILTSRSSTLLNFLLEKGYRIKTVGAKIPEILELNRKDYPLFAKAIIQDRRVVRVICRR